MILCSSARTKPVAWSLSVRPSPSYLSKLAYISNRYIKPLAPGPVLALTTKHQREAGGLGCIWESEGSEEPKKKRGGKIQKGINCNFPGTKRKDEKQLKDEILSGLRSPCDHSLLSGRISGKRWREATRSSARRLLSGRLQVSNDLKCSCLVTFPGRRRWTSGGREGS